MFKDSHLENQIMITLRSLEELNDSVGPTNLRHHISETICRLREDVNSFYQDRDELNHKLFEPEVVVANRYIDLLESHDITYEKNESNPTSHSHLLWMLYEICLDRYMTQTKKNRWLGYVQGCLVKDKVIDVDTERKETRNFFKGK